MNFPIIFKTYVFDEDNRKIEESFSFIMSFIPRVGDIINLPIYVGKNNIGGIVTEVSHKINKGVWQSTVWISWP